MIKNIVLRIICLSFVAYGSMLAAVDGYVEVRSSAFFPSSNHFRSVFHEVIPSYSLEVGARFCGSLEAWIDGDFLYDDRGSYCCKSSISILNGSVGLKYVYPFLGCLEAYAGIGPSFSNVYLKSKFCCCDGELLEQSFFKVAIGGIAKVGLYYQFYGPFFLDLFADYIYQPVRIGNRLDIGGFKTGIGIGVRI